MQHSVRLQKLDLLTFDLSGIERGLMKVYS
jgi:hypothetical protein